MPRREGAIPDARIWERDGTLGAIGRLLAEARASRGSSLFIVGEAGLGKTTMLERAETEGRADFALGIGRGDAAESALPFGIMDQALRGLGFRGGEGAQASRQSGVDARSTRLYSALQFLEGTRSPILILLDDLQWADADSIGLLAFLARRIGALRIAIVGTMRPWPPGPLEVARRLAADGYAKLDGLKPLTQGSSAAMLTDRVGRSISRASAQRVAGLAVGNPLLIEAIATSISHGRAIPEVGADPAAAESRLLLARFTGVSAGELRYAQAASILGSRFRPGVAAQLAELSPDAGDLALEALCRGGLIMTEAPGWARFAHPLLRQALYDEIPGPLRARRHARAFRLLEAVAADPSEVAEHAARADLAGDPDAIAVLLEAGRTAMRAGAISRARQRLQTAAEFAGSRPSADLLMDLGEVQLVSGDGQTAARTLRRLLALPDLKDGFRSQTQRLLGQALFVSGAVQDADQAFESAVASALPGDATRAVEALLDQAFIAWPSGGPALAMPLLEKARRLAAGVGSALRVRADTAWGFTTFIAGNRAGIPVVNEAARHAFAHPDVDTQDFAWSWGTLGTYGNLAKWTERFADATRAYEVGMQAAERMGLPVAIAAVAVMHADTCLRTGDLRTALLLADRAILLSDLAPERKFWAAITQAYIGAELRNMDDCAEWFRRATALADQAEHWAGRVWLLHLEAVLAMHERRTADACALIDRLRALADRLEIHEPCVIPWAPAAIQAYMFGGRVNDALSIIGSLEVMADELPCRFPRIVALGGRAVQTQFEGDRVQTTRLLDQAAGLAAESGMRMLESRVRQRLGSFLRKAGDERASRTYLARAAELAQACGADEVARRVADELHLEHGRLRRRRAPDPDELTTAELRVRQLAEQCLTYQQMATQLVVSPRTIETHLQHIYGKLGIKSQKELIALARDQGPRPAPPAGA